MPTLTVEDLYSLPDHDVQALTTAQFLSQIKNSHLVHTRFFASEPPPLFPPLHDVAIDQLACALVCRAISQSSLYGFGPCVNGDATLAFLQMRLKDTDVMDGARALYTSLFPDHATSGTTRFRDYLPDGPKWAEALADLVTAPAFINKDMQAIFVQPNWLDTLNLVFFKLDQLDPAVTNKVLAVWMAAYPDRNIVSNWSHHQFVPYENISQVPDEFLPDVNAALSIGTDAEDGADCKVYGHEVWLFLLGYPKKLNFLTGARPTNKVDNDPWAHHKFLGL
jgi:hypothetical protein